MRINSKQTLKAFIRKYNPRLEIFLKEEKVYLRFIKNTLKHGNSYLLEAQEFRFTLQNYKMHECISKCFSWAATEAYREGFDFWGTLYYKAQDLSKTF